ncbi:MAG: hypothetical protein U9R15_06685 [Chloroflexota bacterium]|nr:hypothetical protein [Chloroflexota bacterium]
MLHNLSGQGYTEYVVLVGGGMVVAGVVLAMFQTIGNVFTRATSRIEDIGAGF